MEATDIFTFYQNDLQSTSFAAFEEMRKKRQYCDLTITVQNKPITAHRIIVAAGIPYFQSSFDLANSECEIEVSVRDDLDPAALESLILFAYTGKVDITTENVQSLLVTAQSLQLDQVYDSCSEFIAKRLDIHNVAQVWKLANSLRNYSLIEKCNHYIVNNFENVSKTGDFLGLPSEYLKEILSKNNLLVSTEEVVFEAVLKWIKFSPSERRNELLELLTEVRMIYLPIPYLMKQVDTEELIINSKPCRDLVNKVKYYHLMPELTDEFLNLKTRPRNYLMENLYAICSCEVPDSNTHSQQVQIFTLVKNKLFALSSTELSGSFNSAVGANGKIYILFDESILTFNTENLEWERVKGVHECIPGAAVVFHETKIYCFGSSDDNFIDKMRFFDTETNEWSITQKMNSARWDASAASLGEFIYITGGFDGSKTTDVVEKYIPSEDEWMDVPRMLDQRDSHGCTSMNGKVYVCGGTNFEYLPTNILNTAEVYDPHINQWKYISSMRCCKTVVSLVSQCGKIFAFGKADVEVYDPETKEWELSLFLRRELKGVVSTSSIQNDPR